MNLPQLEGRSTPSSQKPQSPEADVCDLVLSWSFTATMVWVFSHIELPHVDPVKAPVSQSLDRGAAARGRPSAGETASKGFPLSGSSEAPAFTWEQVTC